MSKDRWRSSLIDPKLHLGAYAEIFPVSQVAE